jgi:hypothetical protein
MMSADTDILKGIGRKPIGDADLFVVFITGWGLFDILPARGKFVGGMQERWKTSGAKINVDSPVLQSNQGYFFFRAAAVLASFHIPKRFL